MYVLDIDLKSFIFQEILFFLSLLIKNSFFFLISKWKYIECNNYCLKIKRYLIFQREDLKGLFLEKNMVE